MGQVVIRSPSQGYSDLTVWGYARVPGHVSLLMYVIGVVWWATAVFMRCILAQIDLWYKAQEVDPENINPGDAPKELIDERLKDHYVAAMTSIFGLEWLVDPSMCDLNSAKVSSQTEIDINTNAVVADEKVSYHKYDCAAFLQATRISRRTMFSIDQELLLSD